MRSTKVHAFIWLAPCLVACSLLSGTVTNSGISENQSVAPATGAPTREVSPTSTEAGPTQDACSPEALRVYLREFAMPMAGYEFGLIQVYGITNASNGSATADKYNAALGMIQTAHDTIAALQPPDCAAQMQSDMLSSMEDMKAAIQLRVSGASNAQFEAEMTKTKAEEKAAEDEFGVLSARAGLDAASPTP